MQTCLQLSPLLFITFVAFNRELSGSRRSPHYSVSRAKRLARVGRILHARNINCLPSTGLIILNKPLPPWLSKDFKTFKQIPSNGNWNRTKLLVSRWTHSTSLVTLYLPSKQLGITVDQSSRGCQCDLEAQGLLLTQPIPRLISM